MQVNTSTNTSKSCTRTVLASKTFLMFAIVAAITAALLVGQMALELIISGMAGEVPNFFPIILAVLFVIGTVGLFSVHSAAKADDGARIVSGIGMVKCFVALLIIFLVALYLATLFIAFAAILFMVFGRLPNVLPEFQAEFNSFLVEAGIIDVTEQFIAGTILAVALVIVFTILLVACILMTIYCRGVSKAVTSVKKTELNAVFVPKYSGFAVGFGYVIGVLSIIGGISSIYEFTQININSPVLMTSYIIEIATAVSTGVMIFMLSLVISHLKSARERASLSQSTAVCSQCGSEIPFGSAFCLNCGKSVYSPVKPTDVPVTPSAAEDASSPAEKAAPEAPAAAGAQQFCTHCGSPIDGDQKFCTSCGNKI